MNYISIDSSLIELSITRRKSKIFPSQGGVAQGTGIWEPIKIFFFIIDVYARNSIYIKFEHHLMKILFKTIFKINKNNQ